MNFRITFEITEKELAKALLPAGGKITEFEAVEKRTRRRTTAEKTTSPKPRASRTKKAQTEEA